MTAHPPSRYWRLALIAVLVVAGCRTGRNYPHPAGPRYAGGSPVAPEARSDPRALRIVSFNIERARRVDAAVAVIAEHPGTRDADILLLQEMDEAGVQRAAAALGMAYVFHPGTFSLKTRRDFGNAVLSRWPIVDDAKVLLPHLGVFGRLQRTATAATVRVDGTLVRVYSTHLGTMVNLTPAAQRDQLRAVLADAEGHPRVVIGGDMNSHGVGHVACARGYAWPTRQGPRTTRFGTWDHIFFRGLDAKRSAAGTVLDVRGASDHRAVWAVGVLR